MKVSASDPETAADVHPPRRLRGGVIGFGGAAEAMWTQFRDHPLDVDWVAVCDPDDARVALARETFGFSCGFREAEALCAEPLDFVLILSSNCAHAANVLAAADAGLAVFCEKPLALTLSDADAMIDRVERKGLVNFVDYPLRFDAAIGHVRGLCEAGEVGEIQSVACTRFRGYGLAAGAGAHPAVAHPEQSGGWVIHHACHAIDVVSFLAGPFTSVTARTHTTHPQSDNPEIVWGMGELASGATAIIGDAVSVAKQETLVVQGTRGQILLDRPDGGAPVLRLYREADCRRARESGARYAPERIPLPEAAAKPRIRILEHFLDGVRRGGGTACSFRDARHSLAVAGAMLQSAREGGWVRVEAENPSRKQERSA